VESSPSELLEEEERDSAAFDISNVLFGLSSTRANGFRLERFNCGVERRDECVGQITRPQ
jgi:hypothetical protein